MTRKNYILKVALALTLSLFITLMLMMPALAIDSGNQPGNDEPYRIESFEIDGPGNLEVETSGGHITLEGTSSNEMRVEMYVRKNGKNLSAEDIDLTDWDISITQSGNTVEARAKRKGSNWLSWNNNTPSISFVVYSPREMSANLKTSGGHIETSGLTGKQNIATSGGHLSLSDIEGEVEAKTSGGHINIQNIEGTTRAKTSGGHIEANKVKGDLHLKTSGGHIKIAEVTGSIDAKTSGGSINAELTTVGAFVDLRTSGGNVNITVPELTGLDLNLRGSYVNARLNDFSGEVEHNEVAGKLNGGGSELSARTSGGVVSLSF